ncbi:MAG: PD-(D/E)XK nuclease family protein, partial [Oscillospiraceae bacterium]|nr:PD-(D/E)XK nuclease family protein [Oscillospiraceae bacterium]
MHLNGSYYREEQPMALEKLLAGQQATSAKNTLILGAPDIYSEVTAIAVQMRRMVKNGARYRDMALIVRDVESYKTPVSQVFASYGIPYFLDTQKDIFTKPTMQFFTLVLNMAVKGFTAADLLQLLYIVRPDDPLAFDFENYLFLWKTDGAALKRPFVQNPRGFGKMEEEDTLLLGRIEQLRNELVSPILKFKDTCKNSTGEQMVRALFDVYTFFDMNAVLESQIQKLQSMGEEAAARSQADQQNTAIALLDTLYTALQGVPMTLARFFDIYKLTADRAVYATVPQSIDQVTVASATGSIVGGVDIAFVAGLSFGVFPAAQNSGGLFTAKDKDKLYRAGLTLSQNYAHSASQESACVYKAITCADKQVVLSYYDNNSDGSFIGCSEVIKQVKALEDVRFVRSEELSDLDLCIGDEAAFSLLCERANDPRMASLYAALDKGAQSRYQNAQGAPDCYRYSLTPQGADLLFPQNQTLSPSRLELYLQCPFAFFLQSGLGLRPLRQSEISPLETGTFVHYILEQVITRFRDSLRDINEEQLQDAVTQAAADYVKNGFGEQNLTASQKALLARITQNSRLLMTRI